MAELETTEAVANPPQPAAADTSTQGEMERHSSFLGRPTGIEITADQPEPAQETEPAEETTAETTTEEATTTDPEDDPNWLPDEQSKVFPLETIAKYAKRYGYSQEEIEADPRIATFLKDKINSDILIAQNSGDDPDASDEPTVEGETETEPGQATPQLPAEQRAQYYANVEKFVDTSFDPASLNEAGMEMLKSMGVDVASEDEEVQALVKNAPAIGKTMAKFGVDLVNTSVPAIIQNVIEANFPGFASMYEKSLYAQQWDSVRADPQFASLPGYGTKEFQTATRAAAAKYPGFEQMVFTDPKTQRPLPPAQQAAMKYQILAKEMAGDRTDPKAVVEAIETGKKLNAQVDQRRKAGAVLGAGQNKGGFAKSGDDVNSSMISAYNARNGSAFGWENKK